MSIYRCTDRIHLHDVFHRVEEQLAAELEAGAAFWHTTAKGSASERRWTELLEHYLPKRYRAGAAFIMDADGHYSRQIDIAIYDAFFSPLLYHESAHPYIPIESVYAVFEVKQNLGASEFRDAAEKAASVRRLRLAPAHSIRTAPKVLAGILGYDAWTKTEEDSKKFETRMRPMLRHLKPEERLDFGCALKVASFEYSGRKIEFSRPDEKLMFFLLRLMERLQAMENGRDIDLEEYLVGDTPPEAHTIR